MSRCLRFTFYDNWQSSLLCDRGTAQFYLSVGNEHLSSLVHVIGQDGECLVDLRRNTVSLTEKTQYLRTVNVVDAFRKSSGLMKTSVGNFNKYMRGTMGIGPAYDLQASSMTASIHAFYQALLSGQRVPVGAPEATAVVQGCEMINQSIPTPSGGN